MINTYFIKAKCNGFQVKRIFIDVCLIGVTRASAVEERIKEAVGEYYNTKPLDVEIIDISYICTLT